MKQLLTDLQNRIIAEVPALRYVDIDWGQLSYYFPHPPIQWPCALIDITNVQWSNVLKNGQLGMATIQISVADLRLTNTSGKAPQGQKDNALAIWDILNKVYVALQGWAGDKSYAGLMRTANSQTRREDGVRIYQITFTTEIKDNAAIPVLDTTAATPQPKVKFITS